MGYILSKELVKDKPKGISAVKTPVVGSVNGQIVVSENALGSTEKLFLIDERTQVVTTYLTFPNKSNKVIDVLVMGNKIIKKGNLSVPKEYHSSSIESIPIDSLPYQDIWTDSADFKSQIDRYPFHFIDKHYEARFSMDGQYLIVNPYTSDSPGYWPETDSCFYLYSLTNLRQIEKQTVSCERCMNVNIIDNKFIFGKEIEVGNGMDGYSKNIYITPKNNISDTVKIAHDIELVHLSPDGKFILGQKYLYGEYTPVILDVVGKKFQYLLGREYPISYSFYSPHQKKFAFNFGTHIVYIDFPDSFPFDALEQSAVPTSNEQNAAFWAQFKHNALTEVTSQR